MSTSFVTKRLLEEMKNLSSEEVREVLQEMKNMGSEEVKEVLEDNPEEVLDMRSPEFLRQT